MPLVVSHKSKRRYFVLHQEVLAEILGHSNFDGEDWAIGDSIFFEDGTEAEIIQEPGDEFYIWSDPKPCDLADGLASINRYHPVEPLTEEAFPDWGAVFSHLSAEGESKSRGCFAAVLLFAAILVGVISHLTG